MDICQRHIQQFLKDFENDVSMVSMVRHFNASMKAYEILKNENRKDDILEFHGMICAYLLAVPDKKQQCALDFYHRFRDLLVRAFIEQVNETKLRRRGESSKTEVAMSMGELFLTQPQPK